MECTAILPYLSFFHLYYHVILLYKKCYKLLVHTSRQHSHLINQPDYCLCPAFVWPLICYIAKFIVNKFVHVHWGSLYREVQVEQVWTYLGLIPVRWGPSRTSLNLSRTRALYSWGWDPVQEPPLQSWTDRRGWKHYLPATSLASSKNYKLTMQGLESCYTI